MRQLLPALLATALVTPRLQEDDQEPQVELTLELDGASFPVRVDEPFLLSLGDGSAYAVLRREPTRRFELAGLEFSYPSHLAFGADREASEGRRWTLTGQAVELAITRHAAPRFTARMLLDHEVERWRGATGASVRWERMTLGGERRSGRVLRMEQGGVGVQRRIFTLSHREDVYLLVLAENLDGDGEPPAEGEELAGMLARTLRLK